MLSETGRNTWVISEKVQFLRDHFHYRHNVKIHNKNSFIGQEMIATEKLFQSVISDMLLSELAFAKGILA
jgi:hypothetical protein